MYERLYNVIAVAVPLDIVALVIVQQLFLGRFGWTSVLMASSKDLVAVQNDVLTARIRNWTNGKSKYPVDEHHHVSIDGSS